MKTITTRGKTPQQVADQLTAPIVRQTAEQERVVRDIISDVRARGDRALVDHTRRFDWPRATAPKLRVTSREIQAARKAVGRSFLSAVSLAADRVRAFHQKQLPTDWLDQRIPGAILGQMFTPIDRVGIHIPGQSAPLPSSLIMGLVPAQVAGVPEIVLVTPPRRNGTIHPAILAAAGELGADTIFKIGGAQAIAALAYGTPTLPRVDKIFGPGSPWVTIAKKLVFGDVGIDGLYGPSEVVVLADSEADPVLVATDLLAQAEHMTDSSVYLVTPARALVRSVKSEIEKQLKRLPRREIAAESLQNFGGIVITKDLQEAVAVTNQLAAEHVQVHLREPFALLPQLRHAGAIFLGPTSPVPLGDYVIGPSHWLPTGRTARFSSGLGTIDFMKRSSIVYTSPQAVADHAQAVRLLAALEGLDGHIKAVEARLKKR